MKTRTLGGAGISVSAIGLGCMGMSEFYGASDRQQSITLIQQALDLGVNFFDSADAYGPFTNEILLGEALKGRRNEAIIATKFGNRRGENGEFLGICGTPEFVRSACDASLKRLGVECIDLYYQHRVDPSIAIEETLGAMAELVREGAGARLVGGRTRHTASRPCGASNRRPTDGILTLVTRAGG